MAFEVVAWFHCKKKRLESCTREPSWYGPFGGYWHIGRSPRLTHGRSLLVVGQEWWKLVIAVLVTVVRRPSTRNDVEHKHVKMD